VGHSKRLIPLVPFLLLVVAPCSHAQERLPSLIRRIQPAVATVITYGPDGNLLAQGTGFFISRQGHLITNYHVLEGFSTAVVKTNSGRRCPITTVVAQDIEADLIEVLVDISGTTVGALQVTDVVPSVGERVIVVGSPLGLSQTVSDGIISAVRNIKGVGRIIQITAPISKGSSGSPVVNVKGDVVGIATLQFREGQNLNFAIPGQRVIAFTKGMAAMHVRSSDHRIRSQIGEQTSKSKSVPRIDYGQVLVERWQKDLLKYLRAVRLHPDDPEAHSKLGWTYYYLDRYEEAIASFERAVHLQPNSLSALSMLGTIYGSLGRYTESLDYCQKALRLKPENANVLVDLSRAYVGLGQTEAAMETAKKAVQVDPKLYSAHAQLGLIYLDLGRYEEAAMAFEFSTSIATEYAPGFYDLAWTYYILRRYEVAEAKYKRALEIDPEHEGSYIGLGNLYSEIGRYQEATAAFKHAIRLSPRNAATYMALGMCYLSLGDKASMLEVYKTLKGIDASQAKTLFDLIYK
jgi:tetratricopeptide (TPR) repeat protein